MALRVPLVIRNGRVEELPQNEKIKNCYETLQFPFPVPLLEWVITHNLGKFPNVSLVDADGNVFAGEVLYVDENTITVSFTRPVSGTAYIN